MLFMKFKAIPKLRNSLKLLKLLFNAAIVLMIILTVNFGGLDTPRRNSVPLPGLQHRWISARVQDGRRLGNIMFNYASLLGIAAKNNMTPFLPDGDHIMVQKIFKTPMVVENKWRNKLKMYYNYEEHGHRACAYDPKTKNLDPPFDVMLHGYFQSFMYFSEIEDDLRKHFTFLPHIEEAAKKYLHTAIPDRLKSPDTVRVGIHIRRSDQTQERRRKFGYTSATKEYFAEAIKFFLDKYPTVIFVVCSDDIPWSKENINGSNVIFSVGNPPGVDLAILASMDHTIMSVGTFSWWAAWLANGTTIYYNRWPRPFSRLKFEVNKLEYFPAHWIPIPKN